MKTISFERIINEIIEILTINSLDAYYSRIHPYFSEDKLLVDKLFNTLYSKLNIGYSTSAFSDGELDRMCLSIPIFEYRAIQRKASVMGGGDKKKAQEIEAVWEAKVRTVKSLNTQFHSTFEDLVSTLIENYGIEKENVPTKPENNSWEKSTFKFWIHNNLNLIENFESYKQRDLKISEEKNGDSQKRIEELANLIQSLKSKEQNILEEIELLKKEVKYSQRRSADNDKRIRENDKEIKVIETTDGLKDKEPYLKRIQELEKANREILLEYKRSEYEIASKLKRKENQLYNVEIEKLEFKQDLEIEKKNLENINQELKLIIDDKTSFDLEKEKAFLEDLKTVFPFLQSKEEGNNQKIRAIQDTFIFYKALNPNISVPYDRMHNSIKELLNGKMPSKTLNSYLGAFKYQISPLVISNHDELVGIIFALKKCFKRKNFLRTDNNIFYLDFGNGIVCKFHIRENIEKLPRDIALLGKPESPSYNNPSLTNGFLLNKGLYLITSDLIFEMYFDASPYLVPSSDIQVIAKNICDSVISVDEEQELLNEFYDDDEW